MMPNKPDLSKIDGGSFAAPPPDAPRQVADNSNAALAPTAEQLRLARQNEQTLAPLTFSDSAAKPPAAGIEVVRQQMQQATRDFERQLAVAVTPAVPAILGPDGQPVSSTAAQDGVDGMVAGGSQAHGSPALDPKPAEQGDVRMLPSTPVITSSVRPPDVPLASRRAARWTRAIEAGLVAVKPAAQPAAQPQEESNVGSGPGDADRLAGADRGTHHDRLDGSDSATGEAAAVVSPVERTGTAPGVELPATPVPEQVLTEDDLRSAANGRPSPYRPAESDTDSPSRGIPTPVLDEGKKITGGFGDVGEAQYYPLDGTELREVVNGLLSQIHERLKDDLRFSIAVCYPRVRARVEVIVEAYGQADPMIIPAVAVPHEKTPLAVAREYADEICFVISGERAEMSPDGQPLQAPNAMRREAGLTVPYKRTVQMGAHRGIVDRES